MMDHPDLFPDVDVASLGPLVSQDALEQLQNKYVNAVRVSPQGFDLGRICQELDLSDAFCKNHNFKQQPHKYSRGKSKQ